MIGIRVSSSRDVSIHCVYTTHRIRRVGTSVTGRVLHLTRVSSPPTRHLDVVSVSTVTCPVCTTTTITEVSRRLSPDVRLSSLPGHGVTGMSFRQRSPPSLHPYGTSSTPTVTYTVTPGVPVVTRDTVSRRPMSTGVSPVLSTGHPTV